MAQHPAAQPQQPQSVSASPETPSCTYRNRTAKVSLLQTINSLFIVSVCREAATLISGLLRRAYSRLLPELKRQTQMPRSLQPAGSHLSAEKEEEPWEPPARFFGKSLAQAPHLRGSTAGDAWPQHPNHSLAAPGAPRTPRGGEAVPHRTPGQALITAGNNTPLLLEIRCVSNRNREPINDSGQTRPSQVTSPASSHQQTEQGAAVGSCQAPSPHPQCHPQLSSQTFLLFSANTLGQNASRTNCPAARPTPREC